MSQVIKPDWDEADIPSQTDKVILITGANIGLGFEATRMISAHDGHVLMACRSQTRGTAARDAIKAINPDARLDVVSLDLADQESIRRMPGVLSDLGIQQIDTLINNAGLMMPPKRQTTKQGFEVQFGVNHLGHFALTRELFPLLSANARIVNVASIADRRGEMNWNDLHWTKDYDPQKSYGQSKTANLLFTLELTRRLDTLGSNKVSVAAHPGIAMTNLAEGSVYGRWLWLLKPMIRIGLGPKMQSAKMGALPEVYAATDQIEAGAYYGPANKISGHPIRAEAHRAPHSSDGESARRLWEISEDLTGEKFELS